MASFDKGHSADTAHLPHIGSSNKHFLCQSDWYVLSTHFLHHGALEDDAGARIWVLNSERAPPHIDLFVLSEWQVLYEGCVSFDCLCQWSEPTLSSLTVRHCTCFLLMNGSALHRSSEKLMSTLSHQPCESAVVFRGYLSLMYLDFLMQNAWDTPAFFAGKRPKGLFVVF